MVTDAIRNGVWQEMLDAARLVRYYGRLADRYQRRHFCVRVALLTFGLVGASTVTDVLPEYRWLGEAQAAAGLVIAVLVAWDMLAGYATKGAVLDSIRRECTELETELRELWGEVQADELGDKEARRRHLDLLHRMNRVTDRAGSTNVPTNSRLNDQCEVAAYREIEGRYAAG